jgi:hypothetical protein
MTIEEFTARAGEYARQMIADPNRNEDEYLFRIAALAATLKEFPPADSVSRSRPSEAPCRIGVRVLR